MLSNLALLCILQLALALSGQGLGSAKRLRYRFVALCRRHRNT